MATKTNGKHRLADVVQPATAGFTELGTTGLTRYSGFIHEEFLRELQGDRALKTYREMLDNSATVGACLFAIDMLMRQVDWLVEAGGESGEDEQAKELVETSLQDMSQSWKDTLSEILSMLAFGFSYHEIVYKYRRGDHADPSQRSRFDDGLVGWRKIPIRAQETRERWEFDPQGGIKGMWQQAPDTYQTVFLPIERSLLFRPRFHKNNPEGRSCLRTAYRPWYFLKRIEEIEGIGIERDLAGLPVIYCPPEVLSSARTGDQAALYTLLQTMVRNIRRDEQEGCLMPMAYDPSGNPMFKLELLSTGGQRQFNTDGIIQRYNSQIAMTMLADFIILGHEKVGSYALASSKTNIFATALGAWLDGIADIFNRHAIPRLLGLNGFRLEKLPQLKHGDIETVDLQELGGFIGSISGAGMPLFPDMDIENWIRKQVGWKELSEEAAEEREEDQVEQEQRRAEATGELLRAQQERQNGIVDSRAAMEKRLEALEQVDKRTIPPISVDAPQVHVVPQAPPTVHVEATVAPPIDAKTLREALGPRVPRAKRYIARQVDGQLEIDVIRDDTVV